MHDQQNDKYTQMHGQQNDKYTQMHGQQNFKTYYAVSSCNYLDNTAVQMSYTRLLL